MGAFVDTFGTCPRLGSSTRRVWVIRQSGKDSGRTWLTLRVVRRGGLAFLVVHAVFPFGATSWLPVLGCLVLGSRLLNLFSTCGGDFTLRARSRGCAYGGL